MGQMEHLLNVYAAKAAAGSVAEFMGYVEVSEEEASSRLTPGLWLVRIKEWLRSLGSVHGQHCRSGPWAAHACSPAAAMAAATPWHRCATRACPCALRLFCTVCARTLYACKLRSEESLPPRAARIAGNSCCWLPPHERGCMSCGHPPVDTQSVVISAAAPSQMWKYEGRRTLDYYLRRRDCVAALADALGIPDAAVVPTVMQQILEGIAVRRQLSTFPSPVWRLSFCEDIAQGFGISKLVACNLQSRQVSHAVCSLALRSAALKNCLVANLSVQYL